VPSTPGRALEPRLYLALCLSLLLHGAAFVPLWLSPARTRSGQPWLGSRPAPAAAGGKLLIAEPPSVEVTVVLPSTPQPAPAASPSPAAPSPAVMPSGPPVGQQASLPAPMPAVGAATARTNGQPAGDGGKGGSGTTQFFRVPAQGHSVVYVIDRSSSMGQSGGLALARRELLASLDSLPESAHFQVIAYNRTVEALRIGGRTDLLLASAENKRRAAELLQRLRAEGSTDHYQALRQAVVLKPDVVYS